MPMIDQQQFIHPLDRQLMDKIHNAGPVKSIMKKIFEMGLDESNSYLFSTSAVQLPSDHRACCYLEEGCRMFGVFPVPPVYTMRAYDPEIICSGYNAPVVRIPGSLLESGDEQILRGRMMTAAAAIAAGHHKLEFLLFVLKNFSGFSDFPLLDKAIMGLFNEWQRSRRYTLDRAFYLATQEYALSLKNVLFGEIPQDMLENFIFGGENDTYQAQVSEYSRQEKVIDAVSGIMAFTQAEIWLPPRYSELQKYHKERCGGRA